MTVVINGTTGISPVSASGTSASVDGMTVGRGAGEVATNTAVGASALATVSSSAHTTAVGNAALNLIASNGYATAVGSNALNKATGANNTAVGAYAGQNTTTGADNLFLGEEAAVGNTTGSYNVAVGRTALYSNTTASYNTAVGYQAGYANTTGARNTVLGNAALYGNTTTTYSDATAIGYTALYQGGGGKSVAVGANALYAENGSGGANVGVGYNALTANTSGGQNTAIGYQAGQNITTGSANICVGTLAGTDAVFNVTTENNRIVMGYNSITNAYVKVAWTVTSDARDKTDVQPMQHGLAFVQQLNPVSYRWKTSREDSTPIGTRRYGFLAQEIMAIEGDNPVIIDNEQPEHLKYQGEALVPVLVKAIQELKAEFDAYKEAHP